MHAPPPSPSSLHAGTLPSFTPPSTRAVPPAPPSPATPFVMPPVVIRALPTRPRGPSRQAQLTRRFGPVWCLAAAFALGATIAALAPVLVDRGAMRVAAAASLVAGVLTIFAASRVPDRR